MVKWVNRAKKSAKVKLLRKHYLLVEEFQRQMVDIITSYNGNINKDVVDLAEKVCYLQDKLSVMNDRARDHDALINNLKYENGSLKNMLSSMTKERNELLATVSCLRDENEIGNSLSESIENPDQDTLEVESGLSDVVLMNSNEANEGEEEKEMEERAQVSCGTVNEERGTLSDLRVLKNHATNSNNFGKHLKCSKCSYETFDRSNLKKHIKSVHDKIRDYVCCECGFSASTSNILSRHIKCVHDKIKDHFCEECEYAASDKRGLMRHIRSKHGKTKDNIRDEC